MYYTKKDSDKTREIFFPERLTSENRYDFIIMLENFRDSEMESLILNLENTKFIDSAGLGFMLIALQEVNDNKKNLLLKNLKDEVKKSFDMINFTGLFDIR